MKNKLRLSHSCVNVRESERRRGTEDGQNERGMERQGSFQREGVRDGGRDGGLRLFGNYSD